MLVQWLIVGVAVIASALYVFARHRPAAAARLRGMLVLAMVSPRRATWIRQVGRRLAPARRIALHDCGGCGDKGCGTTRGNR
jgi:hypothetical protein